MEAEVTTAAMATTAIMTQIMIITMKIMLKVTTQTKMITVTVDIIAVIREAIQNILTTNFRSGSGEKLSIKENIWQNKEIPYRQYGVDG